MAAKTVTIEEAQQHLPELVESIGQGDEVLLAKKGEPIAKIVALPRAQKERRVFGEYRGRIHMSEDFDEPLPDDFWLGGDP
jgi:antitoxin (DNA-binding transcriptional repressor) of toxin-antitoxin stability system